MTNYCIHASEFSYLKAEHLAPFHYGFRLTTVVSEHVIFSRWGNNSNTTDVRTLESRPFYIENAVSAIKSCSHSVLIQMCAVQCMAVIS